MTFEAKDSNSGDGSIVPMEEDTMASTVSTSTTSSPLPLESDGKQGSLSNTFLSFLFFFSNHFWKKNKNTYNIDYIILRA